MHKIALCTLRLAGLGRAVRPLRTAARVALFDRASHRFLGNAVELPTPQAATSSTWAFGPAASVVVRCAQRQTRARRPPAALGGGEVWVYVELSTTYKLEVSDLPALSQLEGTVRWAGGFRVYPGGRIS